MRFPVRDHVSNAAFVSEVLLYDRLVIPVPDPEDKMSEASWTNEGWKPELLHECLDVLKVKTDTMDGLALTVPWDSSKRERFKNQMSMASALASQKRNPEQTYYMDPFLMTRMLLKNEFRPALPAGVSKAWTVAAYSSSDAFRQDVSTSNADHRAQLALLLSHRFLTPIQNDPKHDMLKRAVDLATTDAFRRKRACFYEWQEEIVQEQISDEKAIEEFEQHLLDYNEATRKAFGEVVEK